MVAVSADKGSVRESTERSTLVLAALLYHERLLVDYAVVALLPERSYLEPTVRCIQKRLVHEDYIIDIPCALICERTVSGLKHGTERREEILFSDLGRLLLPLHELVHADVCRIVIHIAHHDYLDTRILLHHLLRMSVDDFRAPASQIPALAADT